MENPEKSQNKRDEHGRRLRTPSGGIGMPGKRAGRARDSAVFWWMNAVDEGDGVLSFAFVYEGWTVLTGSLGVFCSFSVFLCYFAFVLFYLRLFCF